MVSIEAILKPYKLDDVRDALEEAGVGGMTVIEVLQEASPKTYRRARPELLQNELQLTPKIVVKVVVPDELEHRVIEAICLHGNSGKYEDGLLVVQKVENAIRVRTGETDEEALSL